jgi:hypothetical protein
LRTAIRLCAMRLGRHFGYRIKRRLSARAHECAAVVPPLFPKRAGDRVKMDRRDVTSLAKLHRVGLARSRLEAKPQLYTVAARITQQTVQRRRSVRDPAVLPHVAAQAASRRDNNGLLVKIEPNVSDMMIRPLFMRLGTGQPRRNPRCLHTGRRIDPYSGGHVV